MADLDWIFLAVLAASTLIGLVRGLLQEVLSLLSWIAAFILAQWLAPQAAQYIPMEGASEAVRYAGGFVLTFIATLVLSTVGVFFLKKAIAAVGLRPIDRILGGLFGAFRGAIFLLAVAVVVHMTPLQQVSWWQEAQGPHVADLALLGLKPLLPQEFAKYLP